MPELPEVETIKSGLSRKISGLMIIGAEVFEKRSFTGNPELLRHKKVLKVWRKAKVLGIGLDRELTILFHLKMTGQLILVHSQKPDEQRLAGGHPTRNMFGELPDKSTRVVFSFSNGSKLFFNDQRKFGWVKLIENNKLKNENSLKNLGPEPLEKEFTWQILKLNLVKHKSLPLKAALLDQKTVSGIGNIYASEACFNSGIDPRKKVKDLSDGEFCKLHRGIKEVLENGIKYGGSSRAHFVNEEGKKGLFLDHASVYNREGQKCRVCNSEIKKITLSGRGTFFCPNCQKK